MLWGVVAIGVVLIFVLQRFVRRRSQDQGSVSQAWLDHQHRQR